MITSKLSQLSLFSIATAMLVISSFPAQSYSTEKIQRQNVKPDDRAQLRLTQAKRIQPGKYCFNLKTKTLSGQGELTVRANNQVTGNIQATIQNPAEGYYSSYQQTFSGNLNGNRLKVNVTTKIEYDTQRSQETWILTNNSLNTKRETLTKVSCSASNSEPQSRTIRIKFQPGTNSTVLENSVVRGTRDTYLLGARAGQKMKISITSLENNAEFDIIAPNQRVIAQGSTNTTVTLPVAGDYQVVVGASRGNATYKLQVNIN